MVAGALVASLALGVALGWRLSTSPAGELVWPAEKWTVAEAELPDDPVLLAALDDGEEVLP